MSCRAQAACTSVETVMNFISRSISLKSAGDGDLAENYHLPVFLKSRNTRIVGAECCLCQTSGHQHCLLPFPVIRNAPGRRPRRPMRNGRARAARGIICETRPLSKEATGIEYGLLCKGSRSRPRIMTVNYILKTVINIQLGRGLLIGRRYNRSMTLNIISFDPFIRSSNPVTDCAPPSQVEDWRYFCKSRLITPHRLHFFLMWDLLSFHSLSLNTETSKNYIINI